MKRLIIMIFFGIFILGTSLDASNRWYVDAAKADDSGVGTSWLTAKKTIDAAVTASAAWDTIIVKGGVYTYSGAWTIASQRQYYGSFSGTETYANTQRPMTDIDENGIIEPWEFVSPSILSFIGVNDNAITLPNSNIQFNGFTIKHTGILAQGKRTVTCANATANFVNNTIKDCALTISMLTATTGATILKGVGMISNCLIQNNIVTVNATYDGTVEMIEAATNTTVPGTKLLNSIVRNNKMTLDYSGGTSNNGNARGIIVLISGSATASVYTTMSNCIVHNNEITFTGNSSFGTMMNGSFVAANNTANGVDSVFNNVIANNKGTATGSYIYNGAGLKFIYTSAPNTTNHVAFNNVSWNNINSSSALSNIGTSGTANAVGNISNNYYNTAGTTFSPPTGSTGNDATLASTNTGSNAPYFISPTTAIGNTTDNSTETSVWAISSSSYLKGKGTSTSRTRDKADITFASPRSIGAYEFVYFKSNITGNWNTSSTWQTSSDNSNWISTISNPSKSSVASITIQNGHHITISSNATASAITVNAGGQLTLNNGYTLNTASLTIQADTAKAGTFVDSNTNGGLTLSGNASVQQWLSTGRNWYICSPLINATSAVINPAGNSNKLYWYDEAHGSTLPWPQITTNDSTLRTMKGYIVNMGADGTLNFSGTLHTGEKSITVNRTTGQLKEGFHLIGNPYPSYVNWESAVKTNIGSTIWYRTKTKAGAYTFDTYNATSHEGTNTNGIAAVTGLIPPMQTVWVRVADGQTSGSVTFNNGMRSHKTGGATTLKIRANRDEVQQSLHLTVSNGINMDETILVFHPEASNELDAYDSEKMSNNNSAIPEIFTKTANHALVINGMSEIPTDSIISLGFTTLSAGNFTISAPAIKNIPANNQLFLYDNNTGEQTNLMTDSYNFNSDITSNNVTRFSLLFKAPGVTTSTTNAENERISVFVNAQNEIVIHANAGSNYAIYNAVGQLIENGSITSNSQTSNLKHATGVYLVKVNQQTTRVVVK